MPTALVAGGAGFVGSHVCDRLLAEGWGVVCVDSLLTSDVDNLADARRNERFRFLRADVAEGLELEQDVDWILHLASPASPVDYGEHPIATLRAGSLGTLNLLELAVAREAGLLLASTSEVYGDPLQHPQSETYRGNVDPLGPRSVYDEAKRFSEAAAIAYHRTHGIPVKVARIFNTYGPRMRRGDGRAVPTFVEQALRGAPLTVHGDGSQTRSLCLVEDLVEGLWRLLVSDVTGVAVNLGNPEEVTVLELARLVGRLAGTDPDVAFVDRPVDDPEVRRPDISRATALLGWRPETPLREGLRRTIAWATDAWAPVAAR